jgi:hypothetical protein
VGVLGREEGDREDPPLVVDTHEGKDGRHRQVHGERVTFLAHDRVDIGGVEAHTQQCVPVRSSLTSDDTPGELSIGDHDDRPVRPHPIGAVTT